MAISTENYLKIMYTGQSLPFGDLLVPTEFFQLFLLQPRKKLMNIYGF